MTVKDATWLAGVFDSRGGCAAISGHGALRLIVYVDCVRTGLLDDIRRVVGYGSIYIYESNQSPMAPFASRRGGRHRWIASAKQARIFLKAIRPHVRSAATGTRIDEVLAKDGTRVPGFKRKSRAKVKT